MDTPPSNVIQLRSSLLAWERFRVIYNLLMFGVGWLLSWDLKPYMEGRAAFGYWGNVIFFGLVANVFFSLGPLFESYYLAMKGRTLGGWRVFLFILGLLFSLICVVGLCFEMTAFYGAFFKKM